MNTRFRAAACAVLVSALAGTAALATDAVSAVKYRQSYMASMGSHLGAVRELSSGKLQVDGHMQRHARALAELAQDLPLLFPPDSTTDKSDAKAEIWEQWGEFEQHAADAKQETAKLLAMVESHSDDLNAIATQAKAVNSACRGCHKKYSD